MNTDIYDLAETSVLGGAPAGKGMFLSLLKTAQAERPARMTVWFWVLARIDVVSTSFARESFVAMQAYLRAQRSLLVPVLTNANVDVMEDLRLVFKDARQAIVSCKLAGNDRVSAVDLVGDVDPHTIETFNLVIERGETDARELSESQGPDRKIGQTAWNNRLASLVQMGALIETPVGRAKRYRAIL